MAHYHHIVVERNLLLVALGAFVAFVVLVVHMPAGVDLALVVGMLVAVVVAFAALHCNRLDLAVLAQKAKPLLCHSAVCQP
jgi:hypothetical protein